MGIEPTRLAWKARALPLSYTRKKILTGATGFEPVTSSSQIVKKLLTPFNSIP
jgi:hypothetical protein